MPKQIVTGEMVSCLFSSAFQFASYFRCLMVGHRSAAISANDEKLGGVSAARSNKSSAFTRVH